MPILLYCLQNGRSNPLGCNVLHTSLTFRGVAVAECVGSADAVFEQPGINVRCHHSWDVVSVCKFSRAKLYSSIILHYFIVVPCRYEQEMKSRSRRESPFRGDNKSAIFGLNLCRLLNEFDIGSAVKIDVISKRAKSVTEWMSPTLQPYSYVHFT